MLEDGVLALKEGWLSGFDNTFVDLVVSRLLERREGGVKRFAQQFLAIDSKEVGADSIDEAETEVDDGALSRAHGFKHEDRVCAGFCSGDEHRFAFLAASCSPNRGLDAQEHGW